MSGEVTYNGYGLDEFVPQKTAAYISQNDVHDGEMTVKEVLDFSARCQGVGQRYGEPTDLERLVTCSSDAANMALKIVRSSAELLQELAKKERQQGIYPDPEVDLFMKACVHSWFLDQHMNIEYRWSAFLTLSSTDNSSFLLENDDLQATSVHGATLQTDYILRVNHQKQI